MEPRGSLAVELLVNDVQGCPWLLPGHCQLGVSPLLQRELFFQVALVRDACSLRGLPGCPRGRTLHPIDDLGDYRVLCSFHLGRGR